MISVKDGNNNFYWDQPNESVGYPDSLILLTENLDVSSIFCAPQMASKKPPKADWSLSGVISIPNTTPPLQLFINDTTSSPIKTTEIRGTDSTFAWLPFPLPDSLTLYTRFENDTAWASRMVRIPVKAKSKAPSLTFRNPPQFLEDGDTLKIYTSQPISTINHELIMVTTDTITVSTTIKVDSLAPYFSVFFDAEYGKSYKIKLNQGSVADWNNTRSDSAIFVVSTRKEGHYGSFSLAIIGEPAQPYIAQLLDGKKKVINEIIFTEVGSIVRPQLLPESYSVRLIADQNNNGKWDAGDYEQGTQPERVAYYPEPITIKSNWELELEWNLTSGATQNK